MSAEALPAAQASGAAAGDNDDDGAAAAAAADGPAATEVQDVKELEFTASGPPAPRGRKRARWGGDEGGDGRIDGAAAVEAQPAVGPAARPSRRAKLAANAAITAAAGAVAPSRGRGGRQGGGGGRADDVEGPRDTGSAAPPAAELEATSRQLDGPRHRPRGRPVPRVAAGAEGGEEGRDGSSGSGDEDGRLRAEEATTAPVRGRRGGVSVRGRGKAAVQAKAAASEAAMQPGGGAAAPGDGGVVDGSRDGGAAGDPAAPGRSPAGRARRKPAAAATAAVPKVDEDMAAPPPSSPKVRHGRKAVAPTAPGAEVTAAPGAKAAGEADEAAASPKPAAKAAKAKAKAVDPRVVVLSPAEAEALRGTPLLELGKLVPGTLVRRPSATIKTPYVADVRLLRASPAAVPEAPGPDAAAAANRGGAGEGSDGPLVLAHAPALDCAGMVTPGSVVYLSESATSRRAGAPPTATSHAIQLVEDQRPGGVVATVGAHPQLAERLAVEMLRRRCLEPDLGPYDAVETQRTYCNTRVDFVLRMADGSSTLLEVKNVVCADFPEGGVPPGRPPVGVYIASAPAPDSGATPYSPTALFPHGAQKPKIKVVSDRAIKHVWELTQLHSQAKAAAHEAEAAAATRAAVVPPRLRCAVLFVVNRSDCSAFRPCHEADPLFAQVLRAAQEAGVALLAYDVTWDVVSGTALLGKRLPVVFGAGVRAEYDKTRLQEVLDFNATDPRKKGDWKNKKKKDKGGDGGGDGEDDGA